MDIQNIHYLHHAYPLTLMEHPHQTKIHLFEALKSWLEEEAVADTWLDAYKVISENEELNDSINYLSTALTYDNETIQLTPNCQKHYMERLLMLVFHDLKVIMIAVPTLYYGLRLNERTKYQLESFDLGNIFHNALKYISDKVNGEFSQLDNQKIHALTEEALQHVLPQVQFNLMDSNAYYRYVSKRIGVIVESTLKALRYQNENTKFRPKRFETAFRKKPRTEEELIAHPLMTTQGIPIHIRGQIDRIDTYTKNNTSFVNIIDYKSSNHSANLNLKKFIMVNRCK